MHFSSRAAVASVLCTSALFLLGGCAAPQASPPPSQASQTAQPAPASGLSRTLVGKADVSTPGREAVVARVEVAPGARAGRHTHPGDEISYVSEGQVDLLVDGQPPRTLKAGESFVVPAGVVHDAHNASNAAVKLIGVYVVEKGKPLATPAP
ncbi:MULTISPECIES: cupin domain-containing protein [Comamonas]|uniref:cupin domain-containing protein n=1 Tax=Comamonas TaxID=283 RepID=UPI001C495034|nr:MULTISPECIES: cupin domain-containing protein [Comamonas]MBV7419998.1 cupin domain-containing protein [Comamonas sp. CMM03]MDH0050763.1 cupin domain-containing protein [Comamonas terrigena]MDH0509831.1 cupin domain-containing protein [Comamonas terrigena]MDH1089790.1 cupin domain-containing protein [Comamonas terrigena]MDH1501659.1 cupin domain-containing protein [Comamonas terrigena]